MSTQEIISEDLSKLSNEQLVEALHKAAISLTLGQSQEGEFWRRCFEEVKRRLDERKDPGFQLVGACVREGLAAFNRGFSHGFRAPRGPGEDIMFEKHWLQECYNHGLHQGMLMGRTVRLKAVYRDDRDTMPNIVDIAQEHHDRLDSLRAFGGED